MKILYSLIVTLIFSIPAYTQEFQNKPGNEPLLREKLKQLYEHPELSPNLRFPNPEEFIFSDSIRSLPGKLRTSPLPDAKLYAQSGMPVYNPGTEFSSDMPVMLPDSSIHYFILQKRLRMYRDETEAKKKLKTTRKISRAAFNHTGE